MKAKRSAVLVGVFLLAAFAAAMAVKSTRRPAGQTAPSPAVAQRVRQPAVAGIFYPADAQTLRKAVDDFLAAAKAPRLEQARGLICPHAGYRFSGSTAAEAYKQLTGRGFQTVVVLAPSHYADFKGASIPDVDAYRTPLGSIPLSPKAKVLAKIRPFVTDPPCRVQRPGWWRQASKEIPAFGDDTPHTWEHSLEVQLPFLQRTLDGFELIPVVMRNADPAAVAKVLAEHVLNDRTLFVASSDLSHYYPYQTAKVLDRQCCQAIVNLDIQDMARQEACGKEPILTLMHLARLKGWQAKLLRYRNSGDTAGDKSSVVGYAAIAFYGPGRPARPASRPATQPRGPDQTYTPRERDFLLKLARQSLIQTVTSGKLPAMDPRSIADKLKEKKGCFVTLTKDGRLRGCIGHILPQEPLYKAVMHNARSAALMDKRFPPVQPGELDQIEIEISVLTVPKPLAYNSPVELLSQLRPGIDGVLLRVGSHQATYLPQVWRQIPSKGLFLSNLAVKAQLQPSAWKGKDASVWTYQAEAFAEARPRPGAPGGD